jgi:hypothetical protein
VITFLGWLAALVALLTGLAMLSDTYVSRGSRANARATLVAALAALRRGDLASVDRAELAAIVRFGLRSCALVLIVASSGVAVFLPLGPGLQASPYEVLLRCGLAAFMAMQVPCPWIRWITTGHQAPTTPGDQRHAH